MNKTLIKLAVVAAIPFLVGQAQAQTAAAKAAKQIVKPGTTVKPGVSTKPQLKLVNPADIQGVMSVSVAEQILNSSADGEKLLKKLNSSAITSKFSDVELAVIKEAAARESIKRKATVECLEGLESEVSQRRYVQILKAGLRVLQDKGLAFNTAILDATSVEDISVEYTNTLGNLLKITDAEAAIEQTGVIHGACALRGETNPNTGLLKAKVKARYNPAAASL